MESFRRSYRLYRDFVRKKHEELLSVVASPHPTQFIVNNDTGIYYKTLYIDQLDNYRLNRLTPPPKDGTCSACKEHFLSKRPKIDHSNDLIIGRALEDSFQNYLNSVFQDIGLELFCERADTEQLNMPDFKVVNLETGKDVFYFEFKCIFKPFIKVNKQVSNAFCYSHSMTLDCDDKLEKQKKLVLEKQLLNKTAYVYWYDIPCVKGVFWQFSKDVYEFQESAQMYRRNQQAGDYVNGNQVGHIDKIYLPLHGMNNFDSLFTHLKTLTS